MNKRVLLFFIIYAISTITCFDSLFASSLTWTCPVCHYTFQFDPRDSSYRSNFAQQHLSTHQSTSSYSGGSSAYSYMGSMPAGNSADALFFSVGMPIINQIFQNAGQSMAQDIFGPTPQQQQAIAREQARLRAQQEAALIEQRRREEEQHQKLLASMKKIPGSQGNTLALKSISADSGDLKPKGLSAENLEPKNELSAQEESSPLESLKRAAFLMQRSLQALSPEESAFLSDQAFMAADGQKQSFEAPDVGPSSAVTQKDANDFLKLKMEINNTRQQYMGVSNQVAVKHNQYEAIKKAKEIAQEKVKQQEEKVRTMPVDQAKTAEKTQEEDKLAQARKLLDEADKFETKAAEDLKNAQKEADKLSAELAKKKEQEQKFLTDISNRK